MAQAGFADEKAYQYSIPREFLVGDPVGIRWGSAGDPRGIRAVNWGIHTFCHARGLGFERDLVEPLNAFIILKRGIRGLGSGNVAF